MRLIDVLRQNYAELAARGLRASAWKLDSRAVTQLRHEAEADGVIIPAAASPETFLGIPIEEVPMSGIAQADYIVAHRRFAPCRHPGRTQGQQWDVFDLNAGTPHGAFYATKDEAEAAGLTLDLEISPPPSSSH